MSELTTTEWVIIGAALGVGAAVVPFLQGRRWAALLVAVSAAQLLAVFIAIRVNPLHHSSFLFTLPFYVVAILLLRRVRDEAARREAGRAGNAADPAR